MAAGDASIPTQRSLLLGDSRGTDRLVGVNADGQIREPVPLFVTTVQDNSFNDIDKSFTVPADITRRLLAIYIAYTATATVGNRVLRLIITDAGPVTIYNAIIEGVVTAGQEAHFMFSPNFGSGDDSQTLWHMAHLPDPLILDEGWIIRLVEDATIDALDDMRVRILLQDFARDV